MRDDSEFGGSIMINKKDLSETEIRTRYITPSLVSAGWSYDNIHEEKTFTDGRVIDKGQGEYSRGERKRTDYLLTYNSYTFFFSAIINFEFLW